MPESSFNEVSGIETCNFVKKVTPAKMFSHEFWEIFKNTYLRTAAFESVRYLVHILHSECCLEEEKEYKIEDKL